MINLTELVTGVHVNYAAIIEGEEGRHLSDNLVKARVTKIIDHNTVLLEMNGEKLKASGDQLFPIPLTKESLISLGFSEEHNQLKKVMDIHAQVKKYLIVDFNNPEYPLSLFQDNEKGYSMTNRVEIQYPVFHQLEQFWYKESGGFTIHN